MIKLVLGSAAALAVVALAVSPSEPAPPAAPVYSEAPSLEHWDRAAHSEFETAPTRAAEQPRAPRG